ncbi:TraR/DksA family transcriptional regulator [Streptomyces sp. NPDC059909]|uniref:TraR/DksA family transcriptional regulator n=1 Tax=Streptomyces sp. NPDC059909 TaxID=3346998 RepID=UPI0036666598
MNNQVVGVDSSELAPEDLALLRESLHEQRVFRLEQLQEIGQSAPTRAHRAREQQAASQIEVHIKLTAYARMVLADVEAALERMDRGRYGICPRCTRPIPLRRLKIVPQARYCARCQQLGEARR